MKIVYDPINGLAVEDGFIKETADYICNKAFGILGLIIGLITIASAYVNG